MNLKQWTSALTLCAVTFAASATGVAPAFADDTAAVAGPNMQAAAQAMNAASQQLSGNTGSTTPETDTNGAGDTAALGYDYVTLENEAVEIDGATYLPLRDTFAAMRSEALDVEWKAEGQQKIKLSKDGASYELYLTNDGNGIQLKQGGDTYALKNVDNVTYVGIDFFDAITQTADLAVSGANVLVLKTKDGASSVWTTDKSFWSGMATYQAPAQPEEQPAPQPEKPQPESPDITYPEVDGNTGNDSNTGDNTTDNNANSNSEEKLPDGTMGAQIVNSALNYLGVPYVWGGTTPSGFDCSGLVQYVFAQNGISLPRTTYDQIKVCTPVSLVALQPGDLVFWGGSSPYHVGIYMGDGKYVHAPAPGQSVKVQSYSEYPYDTAGRVL
ncbi:MAG: NlpC/P60 family protein [Peptococcaceae bacterium]|nr:NlpC/P60 family protein [Peptococcaceae bacterium]